MAEYTYCAYYTRRNKKGELVIRTFTFSEYNKALKRYCSFCTNRKLYLNVGLYKYVPSHSELLMLVEKEIDENGCVQLYETYIKGE